MSRCARCGDSECAWHRDQENGCQSPNPNTLECRNRELSNLRSLLRSVTIKLETAHELCTDGYPKSAAGVIEGVLEVLS